MSLPPELIDRILEHLGDDPQPLKAMSLVSKTWTSWCQAHLFGSVHLSIGQSPGLGPAILFDFLSLLPNVEDLEIAYLFPHSGIIGTIPDIPNVILSFRGMLSLTGLESGHLNFKALAAFLLRFSTMSIKSCQDTFVTLRLERSYRVCPHFPKLPDQPIPDVSLASYNKLEEVHVLLRTFIKLPRSLTSLLSSITSQKPRKIRYTFVDMTEDVGDDSDWEDGDGDEEEDEELYEWSGGTDTCNSLDTTLSRLAQQMSKVDGKLTLQLNIWCISSKPFKFDHHIRKFLEYGGLDINST
ncbi:hypothetical protein BDM02DRAFT_3227298 [Thelephora ganbajun]|uniref:Uncharacterized protein n=1 Tax=Thelephora ganbajun TaxID=370292 RepID=A0ACB6Z0K8_THEGA|nr:hypothetical protein BDM02DRAFT_3227298 [Thelephora ganbajun]